MRRVSLYDVWDADMGRRIEDATLWRVCCGGQRVVELGCGDGRVLRLAYGPGVKKPAFWCGIDLDPRFGVRCGVTADSLGVPHAEVNGNFVDPLVWAVARKFGPFDVAVCAFSTLFLVPHEQQIEAVRLATSALAPGGRFIAEVFVPEFLTSSSRVHFGRVNPLDEVVETERARAERAAWVRSTRYEVNAGRKITRALRRYEPPGDVSDTRAVEIEETIYWDRPDDLAARLSATGFSVRVDTDIAPRGFAAIVVEV